MRIQYIFPVISLCKKRKNKSGKETSENVHLPTSKLYKCNFLGKVISTYSQSLYKDDLNPYNSSL